MLKTLNASLADVRFVVEGTTVHVRFHGASEKVRKFVATDLLPKIQRQGVNLEPGTYRLELTREKLHVVYNFMPV